jgi:hypothetical protein
MTRQKRAYTSAAARRKADPLIITLDGVDVQMVDVKDLGDLAPLIEALTDPTAAVPVTTAGKIAKAAEDRNKLAEVAREFVLPRCYEDFDKVSPNLDAALLGDLIRDLMQEYTGVDPTLPESSSGSSTPTGTPSTPGAGDAASTS